VHRARFERYDGTVFVLGRSCFSNAQIISPFLRRRKPGRGLPGASGLKGWGFWSDYRLVLVAGAVPVVAGAVAVVPELKAELSPLLIE
jgi:hypothetical protein